MRTSWIHGSLRLALLASVFLCANAAYADNPVGDDEVLLKNGGSVRGTIVSSDPGVSVKILEIGQKEARVIPWPEVGEVERGKFASKPAAAPPGFPQGNAGPGYGPPPPPPGLPMAPPPPGPGAPGFVHLHVESPAPVHIHAHATAYGQVNGYGFVIDSAIPVCVAPCDKVIDGSQGQDFSAGGAGVTESRRFNLAGLTGDQQLDVSPGSSALRTGGWWLVLLGSSALAAGVTLAAVAASEPRTPSGFESVCTGTSCTLPQNPPQSNHESGAETAGAVIAAVGGAALIGGIVAFVESRTKIDLHPVGTPGRTAAVKPHYWAGQF